MTRPENDCCNQVPFLIIIFTGKCFARLFLWKISLTDDNFWVIQSNTCSKSHQQKLCIKIKFFLSKKHLLPFLPTHPVVPPEGTDHENSFGVISAAPYGSAAVLSIPWSYIKMMGASRLRKATQVIDL